MSRQRVVQVCLPTDEDLAFLQDYAADRGMSLSAAILDMCNFYDKKNTYKKPGAARGSVIKSIMISNTPLKDYEEY